MSHDAVKTWNRTGFPLHIWQVSMSIDLDRGLTYRHCSSVAPASTQAVIGQDRRKVGHKAAGAAMLMPILSSLLTPLAPAFCQPRSDLLPAGPAGETQAPRRASPPVCLTTIRWAGALTHEFRNQIGSAASAAMPPWLPRPCRTIVERSGSAINSLQAPPIHFTRRSATGRRAPWWKNWWS